jgi:hypothetical protein
LNHGGVLLDDQYWFAEMIGTMRKADEPFVVTGDSSDR